ncbi:hypothetical protein V5799_031664 [Amblyomma americanum]|uniref:Uncharacterized protein n=1 Tax=Amblyomma americanum TaxID=6943 RepID=A0AAQ4DTE0_AMBAM
MFPQPPQPYGYGYDMMDRYGNGQLRIEQGDYNNLRTSSYGNQDAYSLYGRMNYAVGDNSFRSMAAANQPGTAPGASAHVAYNAGPVVPPVPSATRASNAGLATIGYGASGATANYDSAYRRHNEYGYKPNGGAGAGYGNVPYAGYGYSPIGAALGGHTYGMPSPYGYGAAGYAGSQYDPVAYGGAGGFAAGIEGYRRR